MQTLLLKPVDSLTTPELSTLIEHLNAQYRLGNALVTDDMFDTVYMRELAQRDPQHAFLTQVQPDSIKGLVPHPFPMLSTNKAYTEEEIAKFIERCQKAAMSTSVDPSTLHFKVTPKLDGNAVRMSGGTQLVSRGDGVRGNDFSFLLEHGLKVIGEVSQESVGELIIEQAYFDQHLAHEYSNARNFVGGVVNSNTLSPYAEKALRDGAIHLVIFDSVQNYVVDAATLMANLSQMVDTLKEQSPYTLDGTVIELIDPAVKDFMGNNSSYHNWQIAKKSAGQTATAEVLGITWQTGKGGRLTPVINITPTSLDQVVISNITAHHARNVLDNGIGAGAVVEFTRAGSVIPAITAIKQRVMLPDLPDNCPCCQHPTQWKNDFLMCVNSQCSGQVINTIIYHFKTIKVDLFGIKTVEKLVLNGYDSIEKVHTITHDELVAIGFGNGQASNLIKELVRVKTEPLPDNLLLASFSISDLGRGSSEKLLKHHRIDTLDTITSEDIIAIDGFGDLTSTSIADAFQRKHDTMKFILSLNFNLKHTSEVIEVTSGSLMGIRICFTGAMNANRNEMKADAKAKGAIVQSSVGKTDYLVCGDKVGAKKIEAAQAKGVEIISEAEYFQRFA